jgi:hypothetical protein
VTVTRDGSGFKPTVHAQLGQDALDVAAQGADGDTHFAGHLPGALAGGNTSQYLGFPRGERPQARLPVPVGRPARLPSRSHGIEGHPARAYRFYGTDDRVDFLVLAEKTNDAGLLGLCYHRKIVEAGEHHDLRVRIMLAHRPCGVYAAAIGEAHVQQARIGPVRAHRRDSLGCMGGDGEHTMATCLKDRCECLAQDAIIVTEHKPQL